MPQENKLYLNIQEQVEKNKKDILDIQQGATVLADFGIKVIGYVEDADELPDPAEYEGDYGDAFAVGVEAPYDFYIFTRAFEGQEEPSWFNIGEFPVPGPQGEQGPAGQDGSDGRGISSIAKTSTSGLEDTYTITYTDGSTSTYVVKNGADGQSALINSVTATVDSNTGTPSVEVSLGGTELSRSFAFAFHNLRGAHGETGEPGSFVFGGQVTSASLLPDASQVQTKYLYLVGASAPYDVYAIVEAGGVKSWINLGPVAVTISDTKVGANSWTSSGTLAAEVLNELVNTQTADFVRIGTFYFAKKSTGRYFCADRISGEVHVYTLDIDLVTGEWTIADETMIDADSNQTITGEKTFSNGLKTTILYNQEGTEKIDLSGGAIVMNNIVRPKTSGTRSLGTSSYLWKELYLSGKIKDGTNEFNADNVFNVINASDIVSNTLTQAQYDLITNGKDTHIIGTLRNINNPVLHYGNENSNFAWGIIEGSAGSLENVISSFFITKSDKVISVSGDSDNYLSLKGIGKFNGKAIPTYPTSNTEKQVPVIGANGGSLSWEDKPTTLYKHVMTLQLAGLSTVSCILITKESSSLANLTGHELYSELSNGNHVSLLYNNNQTVINFSDYGSNMLLSITNLLGGTPESKEIVSVRSDTVSKL